MRDEKDTLLKNTWRVVNGKIQVLNHRNQPIASLKLEEFLDHICDAHNYFLRSEDEFAMTFQKNANAMRARFNR